MIELEFAVENFKKALAKASDEAITLTEIKLSYNYEHPGWHKNDKKKHRAA